MLPNNEIHAVISMPRLVYTDHMFSVFESLPSLNIKADRRSGVFWGQCLSRLIEDNLRAEEVPKYILTMDYDTWFRPEHVIRLYQVLEENPDFDCAIPLQTKRNAADPMMALSYDEQETKVRKAYFEKDISPVQGGHFGLTLFRTEAFNKIEKPWFLPIPNADGEWGDNRVDEDIYFWKNFSKSCQAGIANDVVIGHMQMFCTFSGLMEDGWKPIHVNIQDLTQYNLPEHCIPRISDDFRKKLIGKTGSKTSGARKAERARRRAIAKTTGPTTAGSTS